MFVTAQDFDTPPFQLANLDKVSNTFTDFVTEQEKEQLKKLLGKPLYDAFIEGLEDLTPEQRWIKLRDGDVYEYIDVEYEWFGMKSLLKPFIYSQWLRYTYQAHTGIGIIVPKAENSSVILPSAEIMRGVNKLSDIAGNCRSVRNTLFGYLYNSGDIFSDVIPDKFTDIKEYLNFYYQEPGRINAFDL